MERIELFSELTQHIPANCQRCVPVRCVLMSLAEREAAGQISEAEARSTAQEMTEPTCPGPQETKNNRGGCLPQTACPYKSFFNEYQNSIQNA